MNRDEASKWFAEQMAVKLRENEHKGGWDRCNPYWLIDRLKEEVAELEQAMDDGLPSEEIIRECADIGNFAMMVADVVRDE